MTTLIIVIMLNHAQNKVQVDLSVGDYFGFGIGVWFRGLGLGLDNLSINIVNVYY